VDQFLLSIVLTNCYLLSLYANWEGERQVKHRSQDDFRLKLVEALLGVRSDTKVPRKRTFSHIDSEDFQVPISRHSHVRLPTRKDCAACKGGRFYDRAMKRVALAEIAANSGRSSKRRTTHWGYKECKVALCIEGSCFESYHTDG
jgi:hypothetical protein